MKANLQANEAAALTELRTVLSRKVPSIELRLYASSKHTGVLAYFNKTFIKEGLLPGALGRTLNKAFELRQRGDYREYFELTTADVESLLTESSFFLGTVES